LSAFEEIGAVVPQKIWDGVLGRVVRGERITLGVVELDPDSIVPEHSHENEQVGLVLQGSLLFRIGDESRELERGGMYVIPSNTPHEVQTGQEGAVVVDIFAPVRAEWEGLERQERAPRWPE
jgi:quercetin dioxygenase-like cupin family protein